MKNTIKGNRIYYTLAAILFITVSLVLFFKMTPKNTPVYADSNVDFINRHIPTLEDDFEDNKIIVTLKRDFSKVNKAIDKQIFSTEHMSSSINPDPDSQNDSSISQKYIVIKSIEDLTYFSDPSVLDNYLGFNQILSIELQEHNKQKVLEVISELERLDFVLAAEPSYNYIAADDGSIPNDTFFSEQWSLDSVNESSIQLSWNITQDSLIPKIKVGIFENSIQSNHPDLRVVPGNFTYNDKDFSACHGTHVAGIIGAISNNNLGISGIAPIEIALLDKSNLVYSLTWAIENDIKIINASFRYLQADGTPAPYSVAHANAIRMFGENGGLLVASAGNSTSNTDNTPQYPAGYSDKRKFPDINNVISVGAIDKDGNRADFSCYGQNSVQIYAPGVDILSTYSTSWCDEERCRKDSSHFSNGYHFMSGTSMAAPQVTGVAALLLSNSHNLSTQQIKEFILNNAKQVAITTTSGKQIVKQLNAHNAFISVDFISNGQVIQSRTVYSGSTIENLPTPTRTGYDFGGWYDNPDYIGKPYVDGSLWESDQSITLYAKWDPKDCTIIFDEYGGIVSGTNPITVKYGETFSTNITANKTGNVLDGWYDDNNVKYITADGRSTRPWDKLGNTTLKAKWSPKSYEIQINDDGSITWLSNNGLSDEKCYIQYGTVLNAINLIAIFKQSAQSYKEGKIFDHFEYNDSMLDWTSVPDLGENNSVITIIPLWINEVHTIYFETLCDAASSPIANEYDASIVLPSPSRTGYIFGGWYTAKTGGTKITWATMPDLTPQEQNNGSTQLFARWTPITYKIYYNANGGRGTMNFSTHTYGISYALQKNSFVKTGHDFVGWATSASGQVVYTDGQTVVNLAKQQSATVTLYAVWQPKKYHINYKNLAGNMYVDIDYYVYGKGLKSMPCVRLSTSLHKPAINDFYGWYTTESFTTQITSISETQTGDITIYAKYNYFVGAKICVGTYTVTDAGTSKNPQISVSIDLKNKHYEYVKNTTLNIIRIEVSFNLWKIDDGYQHIYLRNDSTKSILWSTKFDHSGGKKEYTYTIELEIDKVKNTDTITFLFDASGTFSDTWKFDKFKANAILTNNEPLK